MADGSLPMIHRIFGLEGGFRRFAMTCLTSIFSYYNATALRLAYFYYMLLLRFLTAYN